MLEAKAKDQGHNAEVISKKKASLQNQKIVLSSSRVKGIFKDLQTSRPRTSNYVLEDSTSAPNYASHNEFTIRQN